MIFVVFDVESVGLHGEAYAVGAVVRGPNGILDTFYEACPSHDAVGTDADREWIEKNVDPHLPAPTCFTAFEVRRKFWNWWGLWKRNGAKLAADVPWPVEGRFLNECVRNFGGEDGPYPLIDVASMRLAAGLNPLETLAREPDEMPAHNPLNDARQSARLLFEVLIDNLEF